MSPAVKLVGVDFGTTTSSAVVASARLMHNAVTGRVDLDGAHDVYRSDLVFTPLRDDGSLDEQRVEELLDGWLAAGEVRPDEVFGGGALLTGLTAQKSNAAALTRLVRRRLGDALVATADDPCLESWLAFMGSAAGLSRARPDVAFLNVDVGGGTTNLALGRAGEVLRTGCLFVGARHVRVTPGTYRILQLSLYARALFDHIGIRKGPGDILEEGETAAVLDFYLALLEAAVAGRRDPFEDAVGQLHQQVAFHLPPDATAAVVTFSGGVGELVYSHLDGKPWPATTCYGDLGIDLARRLVAAPAWAEPLRTCRPAGGGRATVYGLLRHSTEVSGSTLFLPRRQSLPLPEVPILGTLSAASTDEQMRDVLHLVGRSPRGGCVRIVLAGAGGADVRAFGQRLARGLRDCSFPAGLPLVLILKENLGKVLGHYVTEWGALPVNLVVIDEVAVRDAHYVHVGVPHDQVVPVSFYGLQQQGGPPCAS
jgi:ethanolamine utilization protein EutA